MSNKKDFINDTVPDTAATELAAEFANMRTDFNAAKTADFINIKTTEALTRLQENPDYEHLAQFLTALGQGFLVVDVTGTTTKKKGTRVRTIRATNGKQVLPLFTSMDQLRLAVKSGKTQPQGAIMPAKAALELMRTTPVVAAEINPASAKLVVLRKYIELVLQHQTVTAELLQN